MYMKNIDYDLRMDIVLEMVFVSYLCGIEKIKEISLDYIIRGYPPEQLSVLEKATKRILKSYYGN